MGALSVLAPVLEEQGERVEIIVGTSVGGINAAYLAANAHLPLTEAAAGGVEVWRCGADCATATRCARCSPRPASECWAASSAPA
jgi:hypothetical protein